MAYLAHWGYCAPIPLLLCFLFLQVDFLSFPAHASPAVSKGGIRSPFQYTDHSLREAQRQKKEHYRILREHSRIARELERHRRERQYQQRNQQKHESLREQLEKQRVYLEKKRMQRDMRRARRESQFEHSQLHSIQTHNLQLFSEDKKPCTTLDCVGRSVLSAMNLSVDPCQDFYQYTCGNWLNNTTLPDDRSRVTRSFTTVADDIQLKLRTLLEVDLQKPGHPNAIAGRLYDSCINGFSQGPLNISPLSPFIEAFEAITDSPSFAAAIAAVHKTGSSSVFRAYVTLDIRDPSRYVFSLGETELGLQSRNFYNTVDPSSQELIKVYVRYIEALLEDAGHSGLITPSNYTELANDVFQFEKQLSEVSLSPLELRNSSSTYSVVKVLQLPKSLSFGTYLQAAKVNISALNGTLIVSNLRHFTMVSDMMGRIERDMSWRNTAKAYLAGSLVHTYAARGILGKDIFEKREELVRLLRGTTKQPEIWKTCEKVTSSYVGDAVGAAFVRKHFPEEGRKAVERLSLEIGAQFKENIDRQDWMDAPTREAAKEKLDALTWKIGNPSSFKTYSNLTIGNSFAANIVAGLQYRRQLNLDRLGKPVDKSEWFVNAHVVNAYYYTLANEMVFPAGILQPPFFLQNYPDAMNYGAIGFVVGHEISHGFDNQGRQFDKNGRFVDWWSQQSTQRFKERAQCFVDLFNGYRPDGLNRTLNGARSLGENLADANGVKTSFQAFARSTNNMDELARAPNPVLAPLFTNHQLFFVAYAQVWCSKTRPEWLRQLFRNGFHSPDQFRVQGPLSQNPDFARVFKCKPGSVYNPPKKCAVW